MKSTVHQDLVNPALSVVSLRPSCNTCSFFVCNFHIILWKRAVVCTVIVSVAIVARELKFSTSSASIVRIGLLLYTHIVHWDLVVGIGSLLPMWLLKETVVPMRPHLVVLGLWHRSLHIHTERDLIAHQLRGLAHRHILAHSRFHHCLLLLTQLHTHQLLGWHLHLHWADCLLVSHLVVLLAGACT